MADIRVLLALASIIAMPGTAPDAAAGLQTPPAASAPAAPDDDKSIALTAPAAAESWTLSVMPLPATNGQPASHALVFVGDRTTCPTPRTFSIAFAVDGGATITKHGALLSRERQEDGCMEALVTVFAEGTADAIATAVRVSVTLPGATFELTAPQLAYVRRGLARRRAAEPAAAGGNASTFEAPPTASPTNPAARDAAKEAAILHERAVALASAGRLKEARTAAGGAVAAAERAYGPEHAEVGSRLVNLGMIERRLGDDATALTHYQRAVRLLEPAGPSQALGIVLDNLGRILQDRQDYDGGIAANTRAVEVLTAVLGAEHQHVGYALNNLALVWDAKGDRTKAAELCDRAVVILTKRLGADDPRLEPFLDDQRTLRLRAGRP